MIALAAALLAAQADVAVVETRFHRVHLRNGNVVDGALVDETPGRILLRLPSGVVGLRRDGVERVEYVRMRSLKFAPPAAAAPLPAFAAATPPSEPDAGTRRAVDGLLEQWKHAPSGFRRSLAGRIAESGDDAVAYACALLRSGRGEAPREALVEAVGRSSSPAVLPALEAAAESGAPDERAAVAAALEGREGPEAAALLLKLLDDPDARVWRAAGEAVGNRFRAGRMSNASTALATRMDRAARKAPWALALAGIGEEEGRRALQDLARFGDEDGVVAALQGLALYGDPTAVGAVGPLLRHPSSQVRKEACQVLARLKARSAAPDLIGLLNDGDVAVARTAHWALLELSGQRYAPEAALWERWWEELGRDQASGR